MPHRRSPSFFKILLDASAPHLPLPPDFASRHLENNIPRDPVIRSAIGGYTWRLKIRKIGESYCFCNGWNDVVADIQLGFGDFLVFRFDDKSTFKMFVYSPNGCEKDFPHKSDDDSGTIDEEDDVVVEDADADDEIEVEEDEIEAEEDEIEAEDYEDDYDDDDEEEEEEYEEEKEDCDDDDDDDGDEDGGWDIDGDDGDPFFMSVISETHKFMLRLPPEFVELAGIVGEGTLTMKNVDGKEWETGLRLEQWGQSERYCVSAGWAAFRQGNDLSEGDECVFKFIRSEDKLLLARVTKKKGSRGTPAADDVKRKGNAGDSPPAIEVKKRQRGRPKRNSDDVPATKVEKKKRVQPQRNPVGRGRPQRNSGRVPPSEVEKRKRVQPERNHGGGPASKVGKRKRRRAAREHGGGPASKVEKRKRGRPARGDGGGVDVESEDEVVKRSRGRPAKPRRRGKPARRK